MSETEQTYEKVKGTPLEAGFLKRQELALMERHAVALERLAAAAERVADAGEAIVLAAEAGVVRRTTVLDDLADLVDEQAEEQLAIRAARLDSLATDLIEGTVPDVQGRLPEVTSIAVLERAKELEAEGKERSGVRDAIEERLGELVTPGEG